jgi:hypothetical protein
MRRFASPNLTKSHLLTWMSDIPEGFSDIQALGHTLRVWPGGMRQVVIS